MKNFFRSVLGAKNSSFKNLMVLLVVGLALTSCSEVCRDAEILGVGVIEQGKSGKTYVKIEGKKYSVPKEMCSHSFICYDLHMLESR